MYKVADKQTQLMGTDGVIFIGPVKIHALTAEPAN